jgi:cyclopropane fatty-acyl-phospholipid synthase-like methyltransferase
MDFEDLMSSIRGFQESRAILTAVEMDLFAALGNGATAVEAAERIGANPRSTAMLLNALVACQLLQKESGIYRNTPLTAEHLTGDGRMATMHSVNLWQAWSNLTEAVRTGTAVTRPGVEARDSEWTEAFIAAMHRNSSSRAPAVIRAIGLEGVRRVLDIGGGSGAYAIAFAQAKEDVTVDLLDVEQVTPIAQRHIATANLLERIHTRVGDLRSDQLGQNYDIVFLSAICHMLGDDENRDLLGRCAAACAPGGRVVIQDFILNKDKTEPRMAALFALNMLVGTRSGTGYSSEEYSAWLTECGFKDPVHLTLPGPTGLIIATRG